MSDHEPTHHDWRSEVSDLLSGGYTPATAVTALLGRLPDAYINDHDPVTAATDLTVISQLAPGALSADLTPVTPVSPTPTADGSPTPTHTLRVRAAGSYVSLHRVFPILQSMGILIIDEHPYSLATENGETAHIYSFSVEMPGAADHAAATQVVELFQAAWSGHAPADGFNRLVLIAALNWRQIRIVRTYAAYLQQARLPYTLDHIQRVLAANPDTVRALVEVFAALHDPNLATSTSADEFALDQARHAIDMVEGLDADRILRSLHTTILATTRTSVYRTWDHPERPISIKLDARGIGFLPKPRPRFEIFVHGTELQGVHLRFDLIARGGIRFSDRPDDFRTEILDLVKAQSVKNAVIVPAGAKGGFTIGKTNPGRADVEHGYRLFIAALLELTDNLDVQTGKVIPAPGIVRRDGPDPYLVVAADKGTATFSDQANAIAGTYQFWLGDAFASGGSVGYDHKAMGITAKGAWVSVERHFHELGIDPAVDNFTVAGIGDMSGDVFGNGMLLSQHIRLVAAFDHRHIFIDPTPDPGTSYRERERLFLQGRSAWTDYDRALLSPGAIIAPRTAKAIAITPEVRTALALPETMHNCTAHELVRAVLAAPVDLLWNGGIGTYIKSSHETHLDVGDKTNDPVRVDAPQVRARIIGEGGNLGITQRGRIEFARLGGRINTDALDNSAGVDCSDHEVNIKIAMAVAPSTAAMADADRAAFLAAMTNDVAQLVLANNRRQNTLMGSNRHDAVTMIGFHRRIINRLVQQGVVDRDVDILPTDAELQALERRGTGLSSPELAQLTAQIKNSLHLQLLASDVPEEPHHRTRMRSYFPPSLIEQAPEVLDTHPLRREIVTTMLVNDMVDTAGATYAERIREDTAADIADVARAFDAVTDIFHFDRVFDAISGLPARVPAIAVDALIAQARRLIDRASRWLINERPRPLSVRTEVDRYGPAVTRHARIVRDWLKDDELAAVNRRTGELTAVGAPAELAAEVADFLHVFCFLDITDLSVDTNEPFESIAALYFATSAHLHINTYLTAVSTLSRQDREHALARLALREDLYTSLKAATNNIALTTPATADPVQRIQQWEDTNQARLSSGRAMLGEIPATADSSSPLATLNATARQVRVMVRT